MFAYKEKHQFTSEQTSEQFDVNIGTLFRWQRQLTSSIGCNRNAYKVDMEVLKNDVEKFSDDYQRERAKRLFVGLD